MPKQVRFNDNVRVRNISVDRQAHIQEIKNPRNLVQIVAEDAKTSSTSWWWMILALIIIAVIIFAWMRKKPKGDRK